MLCVRQTKRPGKLPGLFIAGVMTLSGCADRFYRKANVAAFIDFDHNFAVSKMGHNRPLHKDTTTQ